MGNEEVVKSCFLFGKKKKKRSVVSEGVEEREDRICQRIL